MKDKILSIQSKLIYGYVGANISELIIQLHGFDVISFPTVYLAAHTGHQPSYGVIIEQELFEDFITGFKALDITADTNNIITGYIGSEEIMSSATKLIREIKEQYPDKLYICDPVMGDEGIGLYVDESAASNLINSLIPLADIVTPNHFELEYILGRKARTVEEIIEGVKGTPALVDKTVVVTSCRLEGNDSDQIEILLIKNSTVERIPCRTIDIETTGTGDMFTSMLASQMAKGAGVKEAIVGASEAISKALQYTVDRGNVEMNAASILHALGKDC